MKKILLLIALISVLTQLVAQELACSPDITYQDAPSGVYPLPLNNGEGGLAEFPAFINEPYELVFTVKLGDSVNIGALGSIDVFSATIPTIGAITGLPEGLNYSCNPPNCVFSDTLLGCIVIAGTPTTDNQTGSYPLVIQGSAQIDVFGNLPLEFPGLLGAGEYILTLNDTPDQTQGDGNTTTDTDTGNDMPTTGTCAAIPDNLTTSSISDNNAYIYTPQPNGAINNQFRYRPIGTTTWITTDITTSYYRYLSNLLAGTTYEFQVNQICPDGSYSEFSASSSFTTTGQTQGGGNDSTDSNEGNDIITETSAQDIICIPVTADQLYVSSVSTSAAYIYTPQPNGATNNQFRYKVVGTTNWAVGEVSTLYYRYVTGLSAGTTYEYQVQQECATDVWSSYSDSYEFTTATNSQSSELAIPIESTSSKPVPFVRPSVPFSKPPLHSPKPNQNL